MTTRPALLAGTAAGVAFLDWTTKALAAVALDDAPVRVGSLLTLRLGHNPGMSFGMGDALPGWLILLLTAVITVVLGVAAFRGMFSSNVIAGLVLGGAAANVGDRLIGGTVVDFLDLGWWPSFNLADVALVSGCVLLALDSFRTLAPAAD